MIDILIKEGFKRLDKQDKEFPLVSINIGNKTTNSKVTIVINKSEISFIRYIENGFEYVTIGEIEEKLKTSNSIEFLDRLP